MLITLVIGWLLAEQEILIEVIKYSNRVSVAALLIIILIGGMRGWWVFGHQYKASEERFLTMQEEKNAWRETALRASNVASDAFNELRRRAP